MAIPSRNAARLYQWLFIALVVASLSLNVWLTHTLVQSLREREARETEVDTLLQELGQTLQKRDDLQTYLDKLVRDPEFRERIIRDKLGRIRRNELLYHFSE